MQLLIGLALLGLGFVGLAAVVVAVAALWIVHPLIPLSLAGFGLLWAATR